MAPSLPRSLLREIGVEAPSKNSHGSRSRQPSRKDRRKAERVASRGRPNGPPERRMPVLSAKKRHVPDGVSGKSEAPARKSILKRKRAPEPEPESSSSNGEEEEEDDNDGSDDEEDEENEDEEERHQRGPVVSKAVRDKLAEDDAEIADLERKLGLKKKKKLPQSFKEDGLGDLLEDIDAAFDDEEAHEKKKRKTEADEWLAQKRAKAAALSRAVEHESEETDEDEEDMEGFDLDEGDDEDDDDNAGSDLGELEDGSSDGDEFQGFDSEDEGPPIPERSQQQPKKRENPYVAPTSGTAAAKYVPPSRRAETGSDLESTSRIRRQTQGLVNRLTEANMISILSDFEKLYREHPRQHVTSAISDVLLVQICDPASLPETLLILTAGFATALYRVIGMDFGAHLLQATTERFKEHYERAVTRSREQLETTKEASNLITFMSELYNFQLIGCNLLFDYIRLLLEELSELNAELLLRVIRMCGPSLRHDDPMALKDIVAMIRPAMARAGEQNISVRTKFMIETINDLKNNKMKAGASTSAMVTEHTVRMRKLLGSLSARKLKSTEPLRIGLRDLEDSDKRGKWWLVGSSWAGAAKADAATKKPEKDDGDDDDASDSSGDDVDVNFFDSTNGQDGAPPPPDILVLAREQGMNTDVRRAIFVAVMSAADCEDAQRRVARLRLSRDRQREIPNVLLRCAGAERCYNPYYGLVARRLCAADRKVRWGFQAALWQFFRRLGESPFGEAEDGGEDGSVGAADDDDDQAEEATCLRRVVGVAKLYGSLIAEGVLSLQVLKCLNLVYLRPKTRSLVEVMLIWAMLEVEAKHGSGSEEHKKKQKKGKAGGSGGAEEALWKIFSVSGEGGGTDLARGLQYFLRKVVRKSDLAGSKANTEVVRRGCRVAEAVLQSALTEEHAET